MKSLGIRSKLLLSVGILAMGYLLFLLLVQWTANSTQHHLSAVSESAYPAALSAQKAQAAFESGQKDYKDAVLVQDKSLLTTAGKDGSIVLDELQNASDKLSFNPGLRDRATALHEEFSGLQTRSAGLYASLLGPAESVPANAQTSLASLSAENQKMQQELVDLSDAIGNKALNAELNAVSDSNNQQRIMALLLFLIAAAFAGGTILLMEQQVSRPLRDLAERLASGAKQVAESARQVSSAGGSLASGASSQAASLEETSASSNEIRSMAERSAADCRSAAQLVTQSQVKFKDTNRSLDELVGAMDEIRDSSGKVAKIIKAIDDIAFQTNILALNAAVEAARAGDAGQGFAVVAEEVRNLAQRCAKAAQDSSEIVGESIRRSGEGKLKLDAMTLAIKAVSADSEKVKVLVDQIDLASNEQTRGIVQIANSITQVEQVTQSTAASAEESAASAEELTKQSDVLNSIVSSLTLVVSGSGSVRREGMHAAARQSSSQQVEMSW